ncbi:DUF2796 domain-containing protein [Hahella ganghwensis]|uniref:DUF2796 domain-containing protein n=1 Tax=Hahella ganghwensis TaxID=286420 RepID=UPI0003A843E1|nr:DUF2796 domain-containing protein [Hahella ganghwensis]
MAVLMATVVQAEEFEQHGAHEHGAAKLNLAVDGNALYLELDSPAVNLLGFEHMPASEEEESRVHQVEELLESPLKLFSLPAGAGCGLQEQSLESRLFEHETHGEHDKQDDEEHADHHDHEESHADIHASYVFECKSAQNLRYVELSLFDVFPLTEEISAQVISSTGQFNLELTPESKRIKLQ